MNTADLLGYLRAFVREHGRFPTVREIKAGLKASTERALTGLQRLRSEGHVTQESAGYPYGLTASPGCCAACGQPITE